MTADNHAIRRRSQDGDEPDTCHHRANIRGSRVGLHCRGAAELDRSARPFNKIQPSDRALAHAAFHAGT